jgi:hypothetical protein
MDDRAAMDDGDANDPPRKSGGPKCCDAQHDFFDDVVGCYSRLEEST